MRIGTREAAEVRAEPRPTLVTKKVMLSAAAGACRARGAAGLGTRLPARSPATRFCVRGRRRDTVSGQAPIEAARPRRRDRDLHHQLLVSLVVQRHDDGLRRIADIPEHQLSVVVERARGEQPGQLRAEQFPAVPPAP